MRVSGCWVEAAVHTKKAWLYGLLEKMWRVVSMSSEVIEAS